MRSKKEARRITALMEAVDPERVRVLDINVAKSGHVVYSLALTDSRGGEHVRKISTASTRSKPADDYIRGDVRRALRSIEQ